MLQTFKEEKKKSCNFHLIVKECFVAFLNVLCFSLNIQKFSIVLFFNVYATIFRLDMKRKFMVLVFYYCYFFIIFEK